MDVFYYLHRDRDWELVHRAMPSLSRKEFDVVVEYVNRNYEDLVEKERLVEKRIQQGIEEQKAKGLLPESDVGLPVEKRVARLKEKMHQKSQQHLEKNSGLVTR